MTAVPIIWRSESIVHAVPKWTCQWPKSGSPAGLADKQILHGARTEAGTLLCGTLVMNVSGHPLAASFPGNGHMVYMYGTGTEAGTLLCGTLNSYECWRPSLGCFLLWQCAHGMYIWIYVCIQYTDSCAGNSCTYKILPNFE